MKEIILNYIVQGILGGASGYITNDYAINMLFKEYTPLKIGGVIKKTRTEFIDNLSSMVEKDIINKEKLQNVLNDEKFIYEFEKLSDDFYNKSLYESAGEIIFKEVDGIEETINSTDIFVKEIIRDHAPQLYNTIIENINIKDFLTPMQLNTVSNSAYSILTEISNSQIIDNIISALIKNNNSLTLNSLIDKNIYETILLNCGEILSNNTMTYNENLTNILSQLNISPALKSSLDILGEKKVKELINIDNEHLITINKELLSYINSEKGAMFIYNITDSLYSYGKKCDISIVQLLDSSFEENLKSYLKSNIPSVTEKIIHWINENGNLINDLIEEAIDEVINESDAFKAKLLGMIKNTLFESLNKNYNIPHMIISYVKRVSDTEILSEVLKTKIIDTLNNITISEIVKELEKNNYTSKTLGTTLINYLNNNSQTIINNIAENIGNKTIKNILPKNLISEEFNDNFIKKLTEILLSKKSINFLTEKATTYVDEFMSKELQEVINQEKINFVSLNLKKYINKSIVNNEMPIKSWIKETIVILAEELSNNKNNINLNLLNEELFNSYKEASENMKNMPVSAALDKLSSIDNITVNSSEAIRSYAVNNTDTILQGSIKAIASDNLNRLNDDELVGLANDFIGRELKPIMFFGGVLGVMAGLLLAAFQSSPLDPAKIRISNMIVYAFVGYITNVIAINMIFKPYRENKFLAKIPFFKNFSIGYIIKNQKIFAKNTAHFIDNSLLSKNSINDLFHKYNDRIKNSLSKSIANNNYKAVSNLLLKNQNSTIAKLNLFISTKIKSNTKNISNYIWNKLSHSKLNTLLNDSVMSKIKMLVSTKLDSNINNNIYSLINSNDSIDKKISPEIVKSYLRGVEEKYYDELSSLISKENILNSYILNLENVYNKYGQKRINEIISNENIQIFSNKTTSNISSFLLSKETTDLITNKSIDYIDKNMNSDKEIGEVFEGKLKNYIDSKIPNVINNIISSLLLTTKNSKNKISLLIQTEIKSKLGFLEKGMYNLMGGDEIIDELISKIILNKVPTFVNSKHQELENMVTKLLEDNLYKTKVEVLYTGLNEQKLNKLVEDVIKEVNEADLKSNINNLTDNFLTKATDIKLESYFNLFNINSVESFVQSYNEELRNLNNTLHNNLVSNRNEILNSIYEFSDLVTNDFMNSRFNEIFNKISLEDLNTVTSKIINIFNKEFENIMPLLLNDKLLENDLGSVINKDEFVVTLEQYCINIAENPRFKEELTIILEEVFTKAATTNFNFIDDKTKDYLLSMFVDSAIESLKRNLDEILKSIEFNEIAREQIEIMEPKKIHEMFNSFGGKYFKRLMLYGFGGFIFGVNMYVGFALTGLKILACISSKKDS